MVRRKGSGRIEVREQWRNITRVLNAVSARELRQGRKRMFVRPTNRTRVGTASADAIKKTRVREHV